MVRRITRIGCQLLIATQIVSFSFGQDLASVIEECEKSVVRIEVKGLGGDSQGSGFVVSDDGRFVTNVHVLAGATKAHATFPTGQQYDIVGTFHIDEARDICVAQLASATTVPIRLADRLPRKGVKVTALGSPLGLSFTATTGIVSAIRENFASDIGDESAKGTWVQVDAALSPGNSGGPLINSQGEVVAMSTRASFGRAQNLNFGISIADIKAAIKTAESAPLKSLDAGIQQVKMHDVAGGKSDSQLQKKTVPDTAILAYVERGRESLPELERDLRRQIGTASKALSAYKKGKVGFPFGISSRRDIIIRKVRNVERYHFRSDDVRRKYIDRQQRLVDDLKKLRTSVEEAPPEIALMELLREAGPPIDIREEHSAGFLQDAVVLRSYNDHEVIILVDDVPCLIWLESTSGLSIGEEVSPTIAYVTGTETLEIPGESTMSVTVLQEVDEDDFNKVGTFSTWRSGKHSVEARLLEVKAGMVRLEKRDGKTIEVNLTRLDAESRDRAERREKG